MGNEMPTQVPLEVQRIQTLGEAIAIQLPQPGKHYHELTADIKQQYESLASQMLTLTEETGLTDQEIALRTSTIFQSSRLWTNQTNALEEKIPALIKEAKVIRHIGESNSLQKENSPEHIMTQLRHTTDEADFVRRTWMLRHMAEDYDYDPDNLTPYQYSDLLEQMKSNEEHAADLKQRKEQTGQDWR